MDWLDVGIVGVIGFFIIGAVLQLLIIMNVGGLIFGVGFKGENLNSGVVGVVIGIVFGYGVGKVIEILLG